MPDDKTKRGGQDRARVSVMEDYEVKYLAQKRGVTQKAVKNCGPESRRVTREGRGPSEKIEIALQVGPSIR
jgi:hypothetical protein